MKWEKAEESRGDQEMMKGYGYERRDTIKSKWQHHRDIPVDWWRGDRPTLPCGHSREAAEALHRKHGAVPSTDLPRKRGGKEKQRGNENQQEEDENDWRRTGRKGTWRETRRKINNTARGYEEKEREWCGLASSLHHCIFLTLSHHRICRESLLWSRLQQVLRLEGHHREQEMWVGMKEKQKQRKMMLTQARRRQKH